MPLVRFYFCMSWVIWTYYGTLTFYMQYYRTNFRCVRLRTLTVAEDASIFVSNACWPNRGDWSVRDKTKLMDWSRESMSRVRSMRRTKPIDCQKVLINRSLENDSAIEHVNIIWVVLDRAVRIRRLSRKAYRSGITTETISSTKNSRLRWRHLSVKSSYLIWASI